MREIGWQAEMGELNQIGHRVTATYNIIIILNITEGHKGTSLRPHAQRISL